VGIDNRFPLEEAWFTRMDIQFEALSGGLRKRNGEGADASGFDMVFCSQSKGELFRGEFVIWVLDQDVDVSMIWLLRCLGGCGYSLIKVQQLSANASAHIPSSEKMVSGRARSQGSRLLLWRRGDLGKAREYPSV